MALNWSKPLVFLVTLAAAGGATCGGQQIDRKRSATRLELGKDFLQHGKLDAAEQEARRSLDYDPSNERAHNVLGLIDLLRGMRNFRLLEVDDCLTGVDAQALRRELNQQLTKAEGHFAQAVKLAPDYGEAWSNRGVVAIHLHQHDRAVKYFTEALQYPNRLLNIALTRGWLGWAYFQKKDYPSAAKELLQSLQFQPKMCVSTYRLGRVYFANKEWNKALEKFREVASQPKCPIQEAHLYLMKTFIQLGTGNLDGARDACVRLAPKSCVAVRCRAIKVGATQPASRRWTHSTKWKFPAAPRERSKPTTEKVFSLREE